MLLVFLEWYVSFKNNHNRYSPGSIAMNFTIGAIDQVASLFHFACLFLVLQFSYNHFCLVEINSWWYQWIVGYIAVDFLSYWYHRCSHRINILWAGHVTHHSSELFNFSNGFRTSLFQGINRIIFWSILPVFGFKAVTLVVILKVSGVYDFLLHTQYVKKLGFLEKIFITPSSHRVHHGKNDIYIDKNYGSTLVIWDKMFGTYQEETEEVKYGIKSSYTDNNPLTAIGHYYQYLWMSMKSAKGWMQKIKVLIMPPEWKPSNQANTLQSVSEKKRFIPSSFKRYPWFQFFFCSAGIITLLVFKDYMSGWEIMVCSAIGLLLMIVIAKGITEKINPLFLKKETE